MEGGCKLFLGEYWSEVVWIHSCIVPIPLFGIDVPTARKCIRFGSKFSGAEADDKIELGEELQPAGLAAGEKTCGAKVLQVFVVRNYIDRSFGALEIMPPSFKGLENSQEFLIVRVVIEFSSGKTPGEECDGVDLTIRLGLG